MSLDLSARARRPGGARLRRDGTAEPSGYEFAFPAAPDSEAGRRVPGDPSRRRGDARSGEPQNVAPAPTPAVEPDDTEAPAGPRAVRAGDASAPTGAPWRGPRRSRLKQLSVCALVLGALAYSGVGGSFSSFNAETDNAGSSISSGTLTMSDTVNSGTMCVSSAGATQNVNSNCDGLVDVTNVEPGSWNPTSQTAKVTIGDTGSLAASSMFLWAPSSIGCTNAKTTTAPVVGATTGTDLNFNSGTLCDDLLMYIQESEVIGGVTDYYCWWGADTASVNGDSEAGTKGLCTAPMTSTLGTEIDSGTSVGSITVPSLNGPVFANDYIVVTNSAGQSQQFKAGATVPPSSGSTTIPVASTIASATFTAGAAVTDATTAGTLNANSTTSLTNFYSAHNDSNGRLQLYPLNGAGTTDQSGTTPALSATSSRTFTIGLYMPNPTGVTQNNYQGLMATFALTWYLNQ